MSVINPQLCELETKAFNSDTHIWEVKKDGIRIISGVNAEGYSLQARSGTEKTHLFPEMHIETKVPAILDGEFSCYQNGKVVFRGIQHRANRVKDIILVSKIYPATYDVFDVLWVDGQDLQHLPLMERKRILEAVLIPTDNCRILPYFDDGVQLFEDVKANMEEGVIGKRKDGAYQQGLRAWIKVKAIQYGKFVICGYTKGTGWREPTFGALVLGQQTKDGLVHVGSVGTGFDEAEINRLYGKMTKLHDSCPFPTEPEKATWIKPAIEVRIAFQELTDDRKLRFPSYKGTV